MKNLLYISLLLVCVNLSAQQSYQQYKQQREYEQRYLREQRQKFDTNVNNAITNLKIFTDRYVDLVFKYRSVSYVEKNYYELSRKRSTLHMQLEAVTNMMTQAQYAKYNKVVINFNRTWDIGN